MTNNNNPIIRTIDHNHYDLETKVRWGNTEAYKQSKERTKNWTKEDYDRVKKQGADLIRRMAETMDKGFDSQEFQKLVGEHHASVEIFYDCPADSYRMLAETYVSDPRFRANYDDAKPGLAECLHKAINHYCDSLNTNNNSSEPVKVGTVSVDEY